MLNEQKFFKSNLMYDNAMKTDNWGEGRASN